MGEMNVFVVVRGKIVCARQHAEIAAASSALMENTQKNGNGEGEAKEKNRIKLE